MGFFFFTSDSSYSNDVHIDLLKQIISHIFSAWSSFIFRDFNHLDLDFSRDLETFWNFWLHRREQKWGLHQGRFQMRCQKRFKKLHVFIIWTMMLVLLFGSLPVTQMKLNSIHISLTSSDFSSLTQSLISSLHSALKIDKW